MTIDKFKDNLEPHYDHLDHIVEDIIRPIVPNGKFKYFEACRLKMKYIWYIQNRITNLDAEYREFLSLSISENALDKLSLTKNKDWGQDYYLYFPFFEAMEFENLLAQGKACLDIFSKAIGSVYGESPNNIDKLLNILKSKPKNPKLDRLLNFIRETQRLHGVIIDPKTNKKTSIRDIITHRERIDIFFTIRLDHKSGKYILSNGALLNMRHPAIYRFPNYLITEISAKVWFLLLGIIENCFKVQFE
jgi:hypothetical protein